ncbi:hypothetical protein TRVL_09063 [Trypanosoma vivax]|nr:hypothetical protein TRVL_09063 [Trypanosoma vivax]
MLSRHLFSLRHAKSSHSVLARSRGGRPVDVRGASPAFHSMAGITALSLEFFEPSSLLAVHSLKDVDIICRDMLYSKHDPTFEVLRCKAALWIKRDDRYALVQLQTIGELFDVTLMEDQTLPLGCSRALILGRRFDKDVLRNIFLRYIVGSAETSAITPATSDATAVSC